MIYISVEYVVNNIPEILSFFIPGFIFISFFFFMASIKLDNTVYTLVSIIVVSSLISKVAKEIVPSEPYYYFLIIVIPIVMAVFAIQVYNSNWMKYIIGNIAHKSFNDDLWKEIIDFDNGTSILMHLKDGRCVIGTFYKKEENGIDSLIVLRNYIVCDSNENVIIDNENEDLVMFAIRESSVDYIEIYNRENTTVFDSDL